MKDVEGTMIVENVGLYLPNIQHHVSGILSLHQYNLYL